MEMSESTPAGSEGGDEGEGFSEFAALRAAHKEGTEEKETIIEIPGYRGLLWCQYRVLTLDEITAKSRRRPTNMDSSFINDTAMRTLINSCVEFLFVRDGEKIPFDDEIPVRYDTQLADILEFEATTAKEVVMGVFKGNGMAMIAHSGEVMEWIQSAGTEVHEDW